MAHRSSVTSESPAGNLAAHNFENFRNFRKIVYSPPALSQSPDNGTPGSMCRLEETMVDRVGALRRRGVLAGMVGTPAALGAPVILHAAPSGPPVRVGGTLSLTGFLA